MPFRVALDDNLLWSHGRGIYLSVRQRQHNLSRLMLQEGAIAEGGKEDKEQGAWLNGRSRPRKVGCSYILESKSKSKSESESE